MKPILFVLLMSVVNSVHTEAQSVNNQFPDSLTVNSSRPFHLKAQDYVVNLALQSPQDSSEGGYLHSLTRHIDYVNNRISSNAPIGTPLSQAWNKAYNQFVANKQLYCQQANTSFQGNWQCLGPYLNSYGSYEASGRVQSVWIDPLDGNHIFAGAQSGGLWETHDNGINWVNKTDNSFIAIPATMGIYHIAVDPVHPETIYLNTGVCVDAGGREKGWSYTTGVIVSKDSGKTWQQDHALNQLSTGVINSYGISEMATDLAYMPGTSNLFAIFGSKVFLKQGGNAGWTLITPQSMNAIGGLRLRDIEFAKANNQTMVVMGDDTSGKIRYWTYNIQSGQWADYVLGFSTPFQFRQQRGVLDFSVSSNDELYFLAESNNTYSLAAKVLMGGSLPTVLADNINYDKLEISPSNSHIAYLAIHDGIQSFYRTIDEFQTFDNLGNWVHADGRALTIFSSDSLGNDVVIGGTDGGIVRKDAASPYFKSITGNGICITQFYGLSQPEDNEHTLMGGAQDNGGNTYLKNRTPRWIALEPFGDAYLSSFARHGTKHAMIGINFPELCQTTYFTNSNIGFGFMAHPIDGIFSNNYASNVNAHRPLLYNNQNRQQAGYFRVWTKEMNENDAQDWLPLFQKFPRGHVPYDKSEQDMSLSNVDWGYCRVNKWIIPEKAGWENMAYLAYRGGASTINANGILTYDPKDPNALWNGKLYRVKNLELPSDTGKTYILSSDSTQTDWVNITPAYVGWAQINDVVINPDNPAELFLCFGGIDWGALNSLPSGKNRVYYSADFGDTWVDISDGLPALPANKLVYHEGLRQLYLGTDVGVFRCDFSTFNPQAALTAQFVNASVTWTCFNAGLPTLLVQDMSLNYCAGKLRIASFGRGIWETDLLRSDNGSPMVGDITPLPQEEVSSDTIWSSDQYIRTGIRITNGATLTIQNSTVSQTILPTNNTQYVWDVRNVSSGAYLWKIKKDIKIRHTGTLVIAH
ncbi:MAG: hypothetical protein JSS78_00430 [Bacteroidetes bacterium]|nr:hypothetical protein [Bacteroidota bacterium]